MGGITFNEETLRYISMFQDVTNTTVLDCLDAQDKLFFVVKNGEIGKAVGKGGDNVAKLKKIFNKDIQMVEYSESPEEFIRNVFRNYDVKKVEIEQRGDIVHATVTVESTKKGRAIGREGRNLRLARNLIARHHNVQSVSVA